MSGPIIRPTVVTLCGSARFMQAYSEANARETLAGRIVLSVGAYAHSDKSLDLTPDQKIDLDILHLRKIDISDQILVLNVGGYIGESAAREIAYAKSTGKVIRYLESV